MLYFLRIVLLVMLLLYSPVSIPFESLICLVIVIILLLLILLLLLLILHLNDTLWPTNNYSNHLWFYSFTNSFVPFQYHSLVSFFNISHCYVLLTLSLRLQLFIPPVIMNNIIVIPPVISSFLLLYFFPFLSSLTPLP